jgi:hypothetical protein
VVVLRRAPIDSANTAVLYSSNEAQFDRARLIAADPSMAIVLERLPMDLDQVLFEGELCPLETGGAAELRCRIELSPTEAIALENLCNLRRVGVAMIAESAPRAFTVLRTRSLVARSCEPSPRESRLEVRDLDHDGSAEIRVEIGTVVPIPLVEQRRIEPFMSTRSAVLLDGRDLHVQLEVDLEVQQTELKAFEQSIERRASMHFEARADGVNDVRVRGTVRVQDREDDGDYQNSSRINVVCGYLATEDMWRCSERVSGALTDEICYPNGCLRTSMERGWQFGELLGVGAAGRRFPELRAVIERWLALETFRKKRLQKVQRRLDRRLRASRPMPQKAVEPTSMTRLHRFTFAPSVRRGRASWATSRMERW